MTNPCGCEESKNNQTSLSVEADQTAMCPATVHETVCIQAGVTITPHVDVGEVKSFCVKARVISLALSGRKLKKIILSPFSTSATGFPFLYMFTGKINSSVTPLLYDFLAASLAFSAFICYNYVRNNLFTGGVIC
jgi:hypothetical protein